MSPRILPVVDIGLESRPFSSRITRPRRAKGGSGVEQLSHRTFPASACDRLRRSIRSSRRGHAIPVAVPRGGRGGGLERPARGLAIWRAHSSRCGCVRVRRSRAAAAVRPRAAPVRPDHGPSAPCAGAAAARPRPPSPSAVLPRSHKPHAPTGTRPPVPAARWYRGSARPRRPELPERTLQLA